jgi:hypothetical protein
VRRVLNRSRQAFGWISKLWLTEGLMYVRRELDDQHGAITINHLLHEVEATLLNFRLCSSISLRQERRLSLVVFRRRIGAPASIPEAG